MPFRLPPFTARAAATQEASKRELKRKRVDNKIWESHMEGQPKNKKTELLNVSDAKGKLEPGSSAGGIFRNIFPGSGDESSVGKTFEEKIDLWAQKSIKEDSGNEKNIKEAAQRIKDASSKDYNFLILSGLALTSLPDISECTKLESLILHDNKLTTLPDLSKFTELKTLILTNNKLTILPDLSRCTKLVLLQIKVNELTTSPDVTGCYELKTVDYDDNPYLKESHPSTERLPKLQRTGLTGTRVSQSQKDTFIESFSKM